MQFIANGIRDTGGNAIESSTEILETYNTANVRNIIFLAGIASGGYQGKLIYTSLTNSIADIDQLCMDDPNYPRQLIDGNGTKTAQFKALISLPGVRYGCGSDHEGRIKCYGKYSKDWPLLQGYKYYNVYGNFLSKVPSAGEQIGYEEEVLKKLFYTDNFFTPIIILQQNDEPFTYDTLPNYYAWTGMNADLLTSYSNCNKWVENSITASGSVGFAGESVISRVISTNIEKDYWTSPYPNGVSTCDIPHGVYCVQQP